MVGIGFGRTRAQDRHGMKGVWQVSAWYGMEVLVKEFEDTYGGAHELQGFGRGRAGAKNRGRERAKKHRLGWTEAGQRPEVGLERG
jgi:hypothetical protein